MREKIKKFNEEYKIEEDVSNVLEVFELDGVIDAEFLESDRFLNEGHWEKTTTNYEDSESIYDIVRRDNEEIVLHDVNEEIIRTFINNLK